MTRRQPKLVVVSNRGPLRRQSVGGRQRWIRSAGGLVTALDPVLRGRGGLWISAQEHDDHVEVDVGQADLGYEIVPVRLRRADQKGFYQGVSNAILWPLLHSFPPTTRVGEAPWAHYLNANRTFADRVLCATAPDDVVWVHDYHLMLVPGMLRGQRGRATIGWFCHVPWPGPDLFEILPWRDEILEGLLGADLLGFHTKAYVRNFLDCVERITSFRVDHDRCTIRHGDRQTRVLPAPIGVPVAELETLARDPKVIEAARVLRASVGDRRMVLGVDRLDYTKGIPERILAYERFLRKARGGRKRFVYVQLMVPSRTDVRAYAALKAEVDRLVGSVNGRFGQTGQVPIHYTYRNLDQRTLFAHYLAADVALVTPLRDGMNLVAHEYVASRVSNDGVLVLSELAGAAEHLRDAVLVNPYDIQGVAAAIDLAFHLDPRAMHVRMSSMREEVARLDVHTWADDYLRELEGSR